jgi:hypothetical protein
MVGMQGILLHAERAALTSAATVAQGEVKSDAVTAGRRR